MTNDRQKVQLKILDARVYISAKVTNVRRNGAGFTGEFRAREGKPVRVWRSMGMTYWKTFAS